MNSRVFCFPEAHDSRRLLNNVLHAQRGAAFQKEMYDCGQALAAEVLVRIGKTPGQICVMTPAEDADGIAKGVVDHLQSFGIEVRLLCLWNHPVKVFEEGIQVAPILRTYSAPGFDESEHLIAAQCVVGDPTVLKTNLTAHMQKIDPQQVHVLAPTMSAEVKNRLRSEFPASLYERFQFHAFAYDKELDEVTGELKPGIGGAVTERLGLPAGRPYLGFPLSVMDALRA